MQGDADGSIDEADFLKAFSDTLQLNFTDKEIKDNFSDLHYGSVTKPEDGGEDSQLYVSCRSYLEFNALGRGKYITATRLRQVLTENGELLTDEEADELIRDCRPDFLGRIFFHQYRAMLTK